PCSAAFCTLVCSKSARLLETWPTNPLPSTNKSFFYTFTRIIGVYQQAGREQHAGVAAPRPEGARRIRKALCEDCLSALSPRPVKELHHTASVLTAGGGPPYNPGATILHGAAAGPE